MRCVSHASARGRPHRSKQSRCVASGAYTSTSTGRCRDHVSSASMASDDGSSTPAITTRVMPAGGFPFCAAWRRVACQSAKPRSVVAFTQCRSMLARSRQRSGSISVFSKMRATSAQLRPFSLSVSRSSSRSPAVFSAQVKFRSTGSTGKSSRCAFKSMRSSSAAQISFVSSAPAGCSSGACSGEVRKSGVTTRGGSTAAFCSAACTASASRRRRLALRVGTMMSSPLKSSAPRPPQPAATCSTAALTNDWSQPRKCRVANDSDAANRSGAISLSERVVEARRGMNQELQRIHDECRRNVELAIRISLVAGRRRELGKAARACGVVCSP